MNEKRDPKPALSLEIATRRLYAAIARLRMRTAMLRVATHRLRCALALPLALAVVGCSGGGGDATGGSSGTSGVVTDPAPTTPSSAKTWTAIYAAYFGPGTPGHCGNSGCHATVRVGFACGATKDSCYAGLVAKGLIDPANPSGSLLVDSSRSPVAWFDTTNGIMPKDAPEPNAQAAADIRAWVGAGAKND
jgi:hypothetical protein